MVIWHELELPQSNTGVVSVEEIYEVMSIAVEFFRSGARNFTLLYSIGVVEVLP